MNEKENKVFDYLLPLGTVLTLKGKEHKIMITAYLIQLNGASLKESDNSDKVKDKIFDYMGVLWPEGDYDSKQKILFNHNMIGDIYFYGYNNEQFVAFQRVLKEGMEREQNKENTEKEENTEEKSE